MSREQQVAAIAEAFAEVIRQWLSPAELAEVKRRNATYDHKVCATHDFCDANMAMAEAFEHVTGKHPLSTAEDEAACALWSDAWGLAKKLYFT